METRTLIGVFETLSEDAKMEVYDFTCFVAERDRARRERKDREFLAKLDRADEQIREGRVVVKTMEELEAMAR